jgi:outer membrane protein assembly factor BamB
MWGFAEALRSHPRRAAMVAVLVLLVSLLIVLIIVATRTQNGPPRAIHPNPSASSSAQVGTTVFWRRVSPTRDSRTFQGDVQRTGDYGPVGPSELRLSWAFIGGQLPPTIANGIAYTYTFDDSGNQATVYALNASTGSIRWKVNVSHDYPNSGLSIENGILYFSTGQGDIYALDASTGARRWAYGPLLDPWWVTVYDKVVLVPQGNTLIALGAMDGNKLWTYKAPSQKGQSSDHYFNFLPAAGGGVFYLPNDDGRLYAINSTNGTFIWKANMGPASYPSYPMVANGVVFVASSQGSTGRLSAFSAKSGKKLWDSTAIRLTGSASPAVAGGMAFIGDDFGTIYGFNARTGAKIWSRLVGGEIRGLAVAGGRVYVSSGFVDGRDGIIFDLNQATGVIEDTFEIGWPYISGLVVAGRAIYVTASEEATGPSVLYAVG